MTTIKLSKTKGGGLRGDRYQTKPVAQTGIGRFQVYKTDNANARTIGRRPKWTVYDLYGSITTDRAELDTLAEVKEWIAKRLEAK